MTDEEKLSPELKIKWVSALRSGRYEQTKGLLRSATGGFCCLGVLCDVINPAKWLPARRISTCIKSEDVLIDGLPWNGCESDLDDSTRSAAGLSIADTNNLISMNDSGIGFNAIADHIERNL